MTPRSGRSASDGARRVIDLWAERTAALGARDDVEYVLVFENRGAEVGATITHPHGQIYAFDFVPELPLGASSSAAAESVDPGDRLVPTCAGLARVGSRVRRCFPTRSVLVPDDPVPDLPSLDDAGREVWPRCSSTCSDGSTGCSTRRRRTCSGSTSARSTGGLAGRAAARRDRLALARAGT